MLITPSFFFGEINIPNNDSDDIYENIDVFINLYEPECLKLILGYKLYSLFLASPTDQRFQDLLNGKEYTNSCGYLKKWIGLIYTNSGLPANPIILGYSKKDEEQIQAGTTIGLNIGENFFTFDGSGGTEDWRGYDITVNRSEYGVMIKGVDYSWNKTTGAFTLLKINDLFTSLQWFTVNFFPSLITSYSGSSDGVYYFSMIAFYIYSYYRKNDASWTSGTGEKIPKGDSAITVTPAYKLANAYNIFSRQNKELADFMLSNIDVYPEYYQNCVGRINDFDL